MSAAQPLASRATQAVDAQALLLFVCKLSILHTPNILEMYRMFLAVLCSRPMCSDDCL